MGQITGKDAYIFLRESNTGDLKDVPETWAISDFSLTLDKGTVEQELVGKTGNYFMGGALSVDGSFTQCRFAASGNYELLKSIVESTYIEISGGVDSGAGNTLRWHLHSAQVTGYDVSFGDANTITEASIDFTIMNVKDLYYADNTIKD